MHVLSHAVIGWVGVDNLDSMYLYTHVLMSVFFLLVLCLCINLQTAEEFLAEYKKRLEASTYTFEISAYHAYDAIWALAFAFNRLAFIVFCTVLSDTHTCTITSMLTVELLERSLSVSFRG